MRHAAARMTAKKQPQEMESARPRLCPSLDGLHGSPRHGGEGVQVARPSARSISVVLQLWIGGLGREDRQRRSVLRRAVIRRRRAVPCNRRGLLVATRPCLPRPVLMLMLPYPSQQRPVSSLVHCLQRRARALTYTTEAPRCSSTTICPTRTCSILASSIASPRVPSPRDQSSKAPSCHRLSITRPRGSPAMIHALPCLASQHNAPLASPTRDVGKAMLSIGHHLTMRAP